MVIAINSYPSLLKNLPSKRVLGSAQEIFQLVHQHEKPSMMKKSPLRQMWTPLGSTNKLEFDA